MLHPRRLFYCVKEIGNVYSLFRGRKALGHDEHMLKVNYYS
jgi:hypothetical protein